jgi:hypothetical protein
MGTELIAFMSALLLGTIGIVPAESQVAAAAVDRGSKTCEFPGDVYQVQVQNTDEGVVAPIVWVYNVIPSPPTRDDPRWFMYWYHGECEVFWYDSEGNRQSRRYRIGQKLETADMRATKDAFINAEVNSELSKLQSLPDDKWKSTLLEPGVSLSADQAAELHGALEERFQTIGEEYLIAERKAAAVYEELERFGGIGSSDLAKQTQSDVDRYASQLDQLERLRRNISAATRAPGASLPGGESHSPNQTSTFPDASAPRPLIATRVKTALKDAGAATGQFLYDYTFGGKFNDFRQWVRKKFESDPLE